MRKRIIDPSADESTTPPGPWIVVEHCAQVELTSEESAHPIESALRAAGGSGWRAATPGQHVIRILFDEPTAIRRIHLAFREDDVARTQEFSLHWTDAGGVSREILRQQYTFSPPSTTQQVEDYTVEIGAAQSLELIILPDIQGGQARASLARWLLG
jgi:hypothetical protein